MKQLRIWPHGYRCACSECQRRTFHRVALMLRERQSMTDEPTKPLPRGDQLDPPPVGTADGEGQQRGQQHPQGNQRGPALLLLVEQHAKRPRGRSRANQRPRVAGEKTESRLTATPERTDPCACTHARWLHTGNLTRLGTNRHGCAGCLCATFTTADPEKLAPGTAQAHELKPPGRRTPGEKDTADA
jgi:hypothetical protein